MSKKLPIGSGLARAKHNRRRSTDVVCHECLQPLALVDACTCLRSSRSVLRQSRIENPKSKIQ